MSGTHDVISAFLDGEPFDARELADTLSDSDGRELLVDLVALRQLVQTDGAHARASSPLWAKRPALRALAAAAAVLVALGGGYVVGMQRRAAATSAPPPATRVVQTSGGWQDVQLGRMR